MHPLKMITTVGTAREVRMWGIIGVKSKGIYFRPRARKLQRSPE